MLCAHKVNVMRPFLDFQKPSKLQHNFHFQEVNGRKRLTCTYLRNELRTNISDYN